MAHLQERIDGAFDRLAELATSAPTRAREPRAVEDATDVRLLPDAAERAVVAQSLFADERDRRLLYEREVADVMARTAKIEAWNLELDAGNVERDRRIEELDADARALRDRLEHVRLPGLAARVGARARAPAAPGLAVIELPAVEAPAVTVAMAVYGRWDWVERALGALRDATPPVYGVVVVDNASPDGAGDRLAAEIGGITLLRNDTNEGFGRAINRAAQAAKGRAPLHPQQRRAGAGRLAPARCSRRWRIRGSGSRSPSTCRWRTRSSRPGQPSAPTA